MEKFALIKSRVNLNRVNQGIALISDLKVLRIIAYQAMIFCEVSNLSPDPWVFCFKWDGNEASVEQEAEWATNHPHLSPK